MVKFLSKDKIESGYTCGSKESHVDFAYNNIKDMHTDAIRLKNKFGNKIKCVHKNSYNASSFIDGFKQKVIFDYNSDKLIKKEKEKENGKSKKNKNIKR